MNHHEHRLRFQQLLAQAIKGQGEEVLRKMQLSRSAMLDFLQGKRLPSEDALERIIQSLESANPIVIGDLRVTYGIAMKEANQYANDIRVVCEMKRVSIGSAR